MRRKGNRRRFFSRQGGQALVEFALVMSVLVVIIFGIIEWGRLWMTMNLLSGAAREGARVAAVTSPDPVQVQNAAQNVLSASNITGATITTSGPNSANEVTVTIQVNYTILTGSIIPGLDRDLQLTRSAVMHWEG